MISHKPYSNSIQRFMLKGSKPHMSASRDPMSGPTSQRTGGRDMPILQDGMLTMRKKKSLIIMMMKKKEKATNKQNMKEKAKTLMMLSGMIVT